MPLWLQITLAVASVVVAGAAAFASWHQAWTNRLRLQNELFERRFAVFNAVHAYVSSVVRVGGVRLDTDGMKAENAYSVAWQQSRFLFGHEISDYIDSLRKKLRSLLIVGDKVEKPEEKAELLVWAFKEADNLFDVFAPYMKIDAAAHRPAKPARSG